MERNFQIPTEEQLPVIDYVTPESWAHDITPLEYARRILYFVQRTPDRTILEAMRDANVFVTCDAAGAAVIYDLLTKLLLNLGITNFANEEI